MTTQRCVHPWRRRAAAVLAVLGAAALTLPVQAQSAGWIETEKAGRVDKAALDSVLEVTSRALNVRPEPSTAKPPVAVLEQGDVVRRVGDTFNTVEGRAWIQIERPNGQRGWVSAPFLQPIRPSLERVEQAMLLVAGLGRAGAAPTRIAAKEKIRAGFVYVGPVGDAGWTYSHDQGRKALEALPFVEKTSYVDSVPEDPALVGAAIDKLVADGANLVFTTSFGYMDPTIAAAARHPDVVFMHASGFKTATNAGTYFGREYEARYLAGILAGGMTESNIIGYVAAFPIPEVIRGIDAFALGARSVNPDAEVRVLWTSTWYGPGVEREAAERLLDFGADVLTMHQDSPAVVQAAEQRGKYAIGYHSDMSVFAPRATLASAVWDWTPLYRKVAQDVHDGTWEPYKLWWGLREGVVKLAGLDPSLPDSLKQRVATAERALREGRLRIFEGTIRDADGVVRVPSGKVLSDADLLSLDWFVLGVKGDLPKPQQPSLPSN
ncbi:BMP family ABC transporter substrate-binding protein [Benzoatithermus flavus]|uniref:BMP family ABC transporter substrate-binding protein n=1 Tax=Benzoatithermus flavus TaxID=3108223 RepID=A0ABU8XL77_9PROT